MPATFRPIEVSGPISRSGVVGVVLEEALDSVPTSPALWPITSA